jgi:hypothetical protein
MDCPDAQMTFSAEFDGETVPEELRAEAGAHCDSCAECAAFRDKLKTLAAIPPVAPPDGLVDRTLAAVAAAAAADAQAAQASQPAAAVVAPAPVTAANRGRTWLWVGSAAALVAAAVLVFAVVRLNSVPSASQEARTDVLSTTGSAASKAPAAAAVPAPVTATAPPYVTLNDFVYAVGDPIQVSSSQIITAGTVVSSMGTSNTPTTLQAFSLAGQRGTLIVLRSDGTYVRCTAVIRRFQGTTFQLVAGTTIQNFGTWPVLPPTVSTPTASDGSPALTSAGTDDLGVPVFRLLGSSSQRGIAIAPDTSAGDPAASDPNWTWWLPQPS